MTDDIGALLIGPWAQCLCAAKGHFLINHVMAVQGSRLNAQRR